MSKNRVGLQKKFSTIFEGVWIPKKTDARQTFAATTQGKKLQKEKIEQIISQMKCLKDFECYKSGFKNLCKVNILEDTGLVECSPENKKPCEFKSSFMGRTFCKCQLRCYIAENFHK